jgi:hypothetical protein
MFAYDDFDDDTTIDRNEADEEAHYENVKYLEERYGYEYVDKLLDPSIQGCPFDLFCVPRGEL